MDGILHAAAARQASTIGGEFTMATVSAGETTGREAAASNHHAEVGRELGAELVGLTGSPAAEPAPPGVPVSRSGPTAAARYPGRVCRSIKTLRGAVPEPTPEDVQAAALQYVRKISGYRQPAQRNREAFEAAVDEISAATGRLLSRLQPAPQR